MDKLSACPRSHHKFVLIGNAPQRCQCNECKEQLNIEIDFLSTHV